MEIHWIHCICLTDVAQRNEDIIDEARFELAVVGQAAVEMSTHVSDDQQKPI